MIVNLELKPAVTSYRLARHLVSSFGNHPSSFRLSISPLQSALRPPTSFSRPLPADKKKKTVLPNLFFASLHIFYFWLHICEVVKFFFPPSFRIRRLGCPIWILSLRTRSLHGSKHLPRCDTRFHYVLAAAFKWPPPLARNFLQMNEW
jgi:hypothetical protein